MKKEMSDVEEYVPSMHGDFRKELASLINKFSLENGSNTPDFILAQYMFSCLVAFNEAFNRREIWYSPNSLEEECLIPEGDNE